MRELWALPKAAVFDGRKYDLNPDYRDVLEIISYLQNRDLPEFIRWQVALALFYRQEVQPEHCQAAMEYLCWFLSGADPREETPGPVLMDWQQDAPAIISDINKAAGQEIRALPFVHWWTFLSWFHSISQGQLSVLVSIRDKLRRGAKLETWEKEFYRQNREKVDLKKKYSAMELAEQERLKKLLDG